MTVVTPNVNGSMLAKVMFLVLNLLDSIQLCSTPKSEGLNVLLQLMLPYQYSDVLDLKIKRDPIDVEQEIEAVKELLKTLSKERKLKSPLKKESVDSLLRELFVEKYSRKNHKFL